MQLASFRQSTEVLDKQGVKEGMVTLVQRALVLYQAAHRLTEAGLHDS